MKIYILSCLNRIKNRDYIVIGIINYIKIILVINELNMTSFDYPFFA